MNFLYKRIPLYKNLRLRSKLIISYILLISIPLMILGFVYFKTGSDLILDSARRNILDIVSKNNKIYTIKLSKINNSALLLPVDQNLVHVFMNGKIEDDYDFFQMNIKILNILQTYFAQDNDTLSTQLVLKHRVFGNTPDRYIPEETFYKTELYSAAVKGNGKLAWIPTYDYANMYAQDQLNAASFDYKKLFSAVKQVNITSVEKSSFLSTSGVVSQSDMEKLTLVINFREDFFSNIYMNSISIKDYEYLITDDDGHIISNIDKSKVGTVQKMDWLPEAINNKSGTLVTNVNGKKVLICYDRQQITGWTSAAIVPLDNILSSLPEIRTYTILSVVILTFISFIFAYLISGRITNPIRKLMIALKKMGEGNIKTRIAEERNDEIGLLVHRFNHMNERMERLIEENYLSKISEKEAQIMALNLQLNPHFLSNTLNTISWMAIEKDQDEISEMILSLSTMLRYTMTYTGELVPFDEGINWLKCYVFIMRSRYNSAFVVEFNFGPGLENYKVPKLFLQPFVENSIIHGFKTMEQGGLIIISGTIQENTRYFYIEDNGCGFNETKLLPLPESANHSIGMKNINHRIKLLYGEEYGVRVDSQEGKGTKVTITMPLEEKNNQSPINQLL